MMHERPVRKADCDGAAESEADDHVGAAVGHNAMLDGGCDALLPQAHDHCAPLWRGGPLAIDVRSVQDTYQSATETGRMALAFAQREGDLR